MLKIFLEALGPLIRTTKETFSFVKQINKRTLLALAAGLFIGFLFGRFLPWPTHHTKTLGGVDLAAYCASYHFDSGSKEACSSKINLDHACDWQYDQSGLRLIFKSSDPNSGICYDRHHQPIGGIRDMPGYCRTTYKTSLDVKATVIANKTWVCRTRVDMRLACTWQYQKLDVIARQDDEGNWSCLG